MGKVKLLHGEVSNHEHIPAAQEMSLDALYEIASEFGKVEIGGFLGAESVQINLNFTGDDFVAIKCRRHRNMKRNLSAAIDKARLYQFFYEDNIRRLS